MIASIFTLVACNNTDDEDKTDESGNAIPVLTTRKIESSIKALVNQNYSCDLTAGSNSVAYKFDKDKISVVENKSEYFYSIEDSGTFKLEYNSSKVAYVKTTSSFDIDEVIYNSLNSATWKEYNKEKDIIFGSMDGKDVTLKIKDNGSLDIEGESYKASIFDVGSTSVTLPSNIVDDTVEAEIPLDKINATIQKLEAKNYTFNLVDKGVTSVYKVAGNSIAIEKNKSTKYYVREDDTAFDIILNTNDNKWHKSFAEVDLDTNDLIYNSLKSATWTAYNESTGVVSGTMNEEQIILEISNDIIKVSSETFEAKITNINATVVTLPDKSEIIDDTNEIYTIVDGEIVYNMVAITDVLTRWIKHDNVQNRDLIGYKSFNKNISLDNIIYFNVLESILEIGLMYNYSGKIIYTTYEIGDTPFDEIGDNVFLPRLKNGEITTKKEMLSDLKNMSILDFNNSGLNRELDYTTLDNDYETTHKEQFDKLTSQVLTRLKDTGVQVSYNNQNGIKEDLTSMEIIAGFKGKQTNSSSTGSDLGIYHAWNQYYLVKVGGKYQMLDFEILSSMTYNYDVVGNVMNGMMGWLIRNLDKKNLDKGTGAIYQKDKNQDTTPTFLIEQLYTPIAIHSKQKSA